MEITRERREYQYTLKLTHREASIIEDCLNLADNRFDDLVDLFAVDELEHVEVKRLWNQLFETLTLY